MELKNQTSQNYQPGDVVYVIIHNPRAQDIAHVQEAAVVENPEDPSKLSLFLYGTYFPLSNEFAIYRSLDEAEQAYNDVFGIEDFYG